MLKLLKHKRQGRDNADQSSKRNAYLLVSEGDRQRWNRSAMVPRANQDYSSGTARAAGAIAASDSFTTVHARAGAMPVMKSADYKCMHCNQIESYEASYGEELPEAINHYCYMVELNWPMHRQYSPPHTGRGSSGEKPK